MAHPLTADDRAAFLRAVIADPADDLPECACASCERWRKGQGRPTHAELLALELSGGDMAQITGPAAVPE